MDIEELFKTGGIKIYGNKSKRILDTNVLHKNSSS